MQIVCDSYRNIENLPPEVRPFEKMLREGEERLSDAELVAVLLRSGTKGKNALDLARDLLYPVDGSGGLNRLRDLSATEMQDISGIGPVKAGQLKACVELANRLQLPESTERLDFGSPERVYELLRPELQYLPYEQVLALLLDSKNRLIRKILISQGGLTSAVIRPRDIFREAVRTSAASIILVHNHPSGYCEPSGADYETTKALKKAGELMGIALNDHVVIARDGYYSMRAGSTIWHMR